ncbi:MAG: site-2 protease family protein, partial [Chitinophagaceae bacterium]
KNGDKIISIDQKRLTEFDPSKITGGIILNQSKSIQVERNGVEKNIQIPDGFVRQLILQKGQFFVQPRFPLTPIAKIQSFSAASKMGLQVHDQILAVNGEPIEYFDQFKKEITGNTGKEVFLKVLRTPVDTVYLSGLVPSSGVLGIFTRTDSIFNFATHRYTFFQSIPAGAEKCVHTLVMYVRNLKLLFTSKEVKASESLGGFITIGNLFPSVWDWQAFWSMTALLSIILAFMNILPIPALDGGHVLFLLYEMITGRKPSDKFLEYAQVIGMALLFGLLIYANGLDIWRHWFKH